MGRRSEPLSLSQIEVLILWGELGPAHQVQQEEGAPAFAGEVPALQPLWQKYHPPAAPIPAKLSGGLCGGVGRPAEVIPFIASIALQRGTGFLHCLDGAGTLRFTFRWVSGVVYELSGGPSESYFGQLLHRSGLVDGDALQSALSTAGQTGLPLGVSLSEQGLLSHRELRALLNEQLGERLEALAHCEQLQLLFIPTEMAEQRPHSRPYSDLVRLSGLSLVGALVGLTLTPSQARETITSLAACRVRGERLRLLGDQLSGEDKALLERAQREGLEALVQSTPLPAQRLAVRLVTWSQLGLFRAGGGEELGALAERIERADCLLQLQLNPESSPAEHKEQLRQLRLQAQLERPSESSVEDQLKRRLRSRLQLIEQLLSDPIERACYQRLAERGEDPNDPQLRRGLIYDYCLQQGRQALKRERYPLAARLLERASALQPRELSLAAEAAWVRFLGSEQEDADKAQALSTLKQIQVQRKEDPEPLLYSAKICRLAGDIAGAEEQLRALLKLDPEHSEAQREQYFLHSREYQRKQRRSRGDRQGAEKNPAHQLLQQGLALAALLVAGLWFTANRVEDQRSYWPEVVNVETNLQSSQNLFRRRSQFFRALRKSYSEESIKRAASALGYQPQSDTISRRLGAYLGSLFNRFESGERQEVLRALRQTQQIPQEQRVWGNVEGYWLWEDSFAWLRRLALIFAGLAGLLWLRKALPDASPPRFLGDSGRWVFFGLLYGIAIAFLSPTLRTPTSGAQLYLIGSAHVLAEQLFLTLFVGGICSQLFRARLFLLVPALFVAFAVYRMSFFSVGNIFPIAIQSGLVIGAASGVLLWRSKGTLAPLVMQLTIQLLIIARSGAH